MALRRNRDLAGRKFNDSENAQTFKVLFRRQKSARGPMRHPNS